MSRVPLPVAALLLCACATDEIVVGPPPPIADPAQAAEVTVIRPRTIVASEFPFYITIGEQPIFDLRSGEYTRFPLPAGKRSFAIRCLGGTAAKPVETRIEHEFIARRAAIFLIEPKFECASITPIDEKTAEPLLARTRFRAVGTTSKLAETSATVPTAISTAPTVSAAPMSPKDQVAAATAAWVEAFNSRDPARITARYDPEALLWGASAQRLAAGPAAIAEYFKDVLAPQRPAVPVSLGEQHVRVYGDTAIDTGSYTFWVLRDGKTEAIPARYSFVYRNRDGKWLIVDHHSSQIPAP